MVTTAIAQRGRGDAGYQELLDYLRVTSIPTEITDGVPLMQVEAKNAQRSYLPNVTNEQFSDKKFVNVSGSNSGVSSHANTVANRYFSNTSFITGANNIDVYEAGDFVNNALRTTGRVSNFDAKVASLAWIASESNLSLVSLFSIYLNRYDYASSTGNTLMVAGLNNGSGSSVPTLWGQSYNGVVVGRTDGRHSRNGTLDTYEGVGFTEGRVKPDIVAQDTTTSWGTGQVSSAVGYLYGYANLLGHTAITENTDLLKAVLLAGATKEEFPNWGNMANDNSVSSSLDPVFGAGEVNVFNSHRIIEGGEPVGGEIPLHGWAQILNIEKNSVIYTFTVPDSAGEVQFNMSLCWHREIEEVTQNNQIFYEPKDLADLRLELSGESLSELIVSDSSVDNVEYLHMPKLSPGTYSVTISNNTGNISADAGLAWRINLGEEVTQVVTQVVSDVGLKLSGLVPGVQYEIWESDDLSSFRFSEGFTATSGTKTWMVPKDTGKGHFYQVKFWK